MIEFLTRMKGSNTKHSCFLSVYGTVEQLEKILNEKFGFKKISVQLGNTMLSTAN